MTEGLTESSNPEAGQLDEGVFSNRETGLNSTAQEARVMFIETRSG
jgi:hypothetical protein